MCAGPSGQPGPLLTLQGSTLLHLAGHSLRAAGSISTSVACPEILAGSLGCKISHLAGLEGHGALGQRRGSPALAVAAGSALGSLVQHHGGHCDRDRLCGSWAGWACTSPLGDLCARPVRPLLGLDPLPRLQQAFERSRVCYKIRGEAELAVRRHRLLHLNSPRAAAP